MNKERAKRMARLARHRRVRKKISGTAERPRLCVYRSLKHLYVQFIDDTRGVTLASASTLSPEFKQKNMSTGSDVEAAKAVGQLAAEEALRRGIKEVVFDKNGFKYHGKIRALAEAAREQGLKF